jgi:hypothetical protein
MTKEDGRYAFDIDVAYIADVDELIEVVKQGKEELRNGPRII